MPTSRALCCLPSVKKQKHDFHFFPSMYNKTIIKFGFCNIQNQGPIRVINHSPQPSALADIRPYLDFDYSGYHKHFIQQLFIVIIIVVVILITSKEFPCVIVDQSVRIC